MLQIIDEFSEIFEAHSVQVTTPNVVQTLTVDDLIRLVPLHDGWIIGDDPATREVFERAKQGKLKAAVKWGIGVDNVDLQACEDLGIPITNTPGMFGAEVADLALGYIIALARQTFDIDRGVRAGRWLKPQGISLAGRTAAVVGYGDIGQCLSDRLRAIGMNTIVYDPYIAPESNQAHLSLAVWPERLQEADFVVTTCALTESSRYLINSESLSAMKPGVRIVNVSRGAIIDEAALVSFLQSGKVFSAALDVFEQEPLPQTSPLLLHPHCVFGSHNASNTSEAVLRTSRIALEKLFRLIGASR